MVQTLWGRLPFVKAAAVSWRRAAAAAALTCCAAVGAVQAASDDKQLNIYNWSDYIAPTTIPNFEKETGIKNVKVGS